MGPVAGQLAPPDDRVPFLQRQAPHGDALPSLARRTRDRVCLRRRAPCDIRIGSQTCFCRPRQGRGRPLTVRFRGSWRFCDPRQASAMGCRRFVSAVRRRSGSPLRWRRCPASRPAPARGGRRARRGPRLRREEDDLRLGGAPHAERRTRVPSGAGSMVARVRASRPWGRRKAATTFNRGEVGPGERRVPRPPANGTMLSAVPWMWRKGIARGTARRAVSIVPATVARAATRSGRRARRSGPSSRRSTCP